MTFIVSYIYIHLFILDGYTAISINVVGSKHKAKKKLQFTYSEPHMGKVWKNLSVGSILVE